MSTALPVPPISSSKSTPGDGVHDDTAFIQEQLDSRRATIHLPPPAVRYLISRPLIIHSRQSLILDPGTVIRLAPQSNCLMITNDDHAGGNEEISVIGGIWDMDNRQQEPNPIRQICRDKNLSQPYDPNRYLGIAMRFVGVTRFALKNITFRDPVTFCTQFARLQYFTIDDITFDFQHWNPVPHNMDGIHLDGGCRHGRITNLKGATYDDLLAINADDVEAESPGVGPIEDISVDGIYATDCQSVVRILSAGSPVRRISISNVHATCYLYGIGFTKYFKRETKGSIDAITLRNIHLAKAPRLPHYLRDKSPDFPLLWIEGGLVVHHLTIDRIHRDESVSTAPLLRVDQGAEVETLILRDVSVRNRLDAPMDTILNEGVIGHVALPDGAPDDILVNRGTVAKVSRS